MTTRKSKKSMAASRGLRILFAGTCLIASVGILYVGEQLIAAAGWGVLWMAVYFLAARLKYRSLVTTDNFADSFYYLGFLLTLVALIGTLYRMGGVGGEINLESVLANFAVALTTTLIGLAGRVWLATFRLEGEELAASAQQDAENAYERFTRALNTMSSELHTSATEIGRRMERVFEPIEPAVERLTTDLDSATAELDPLSERIRMLDLAISGSAQKVHDQVEDRGQRLHEQTESWLQMVNKQIDTLVRSVSAIETVAVGLHDRAHEAGDKVSNAGDDYRERLAEAARSLKGPVQAIHTLAAQVQSVQTMSEQSLEVVEQRSEALGSSLTRLNDSASTLADTMTLEEKALRDRLEGWKSSTAVLDLLHERIEGVAKRTGEATERVAENAEDLQETIARCQEGLGRLAATVEQEGGIVRSGITQWKEALEGLEQLHEQLLRAVVSSTKTSAVVREEIAEGVRALNRSLATGRTDHIEA